MEHDEHNETPYYPKLGARVEKFRRLAMFAGSIVGMSRELRRAYGEAVCEAIRALQRRELLACLTPCPSTKGYHNDREYGEAVLAPYRTKAVNDHKPLGGSEKNGVYVYDWQAAYAAAMAETRANREAAHAR